MFLKEAIVILPKWKRILPSTLLLWYIVFSSTLCALLCKFKVVALYRNIITPIYKFFYHSSFVRNSRASHTCQRSRWTGFARRWQVCPSLLIWQTRERKQRVLSLSYSMIFLIFARIILYSHRKSGHHLGAKVAKIIDFISVLMDGKSCIYNDFHNSRLLDNKKLILFFMRKDFAESLFPS